MHFLKRIASKFRMAKYRYLLRGYIPQDAELIVEANDPEAAANQVWAAIKSGTITWTPGLFRPEDIDVLNVEEIK